MSQEIIDGLNYAIIIIAFGYGISLGFKNYLLKMIFIFANLFGSGATLSQNVFGRFADGLFLSVVIWYVFVDKFYLQNIVEKIVS